MTQELRCQYALENQVGQQSPGAGVDIPCCQSTDSWQRREVCAKSVDLLPASIGLMSACSVRLIWPSLVELLRVWCRWAIIPVAGLSRRSAGHEHVMQPIIQTLFNPLTAAIRGSGYKLFVKWCRYPGARLECYLQNGAVIRRPS